MSMTYIQLFLSGYSYPYSVITDGTTDQTSVLQSVLNAAASGGGTVMLPLGPVVTDLTGLIVPPKVVLVGQGNARPYTAGIPNAGSWLISPNASYGSGSNPVLTLQGYNTLKDFAIYGPGNGYGSSTSRPNVRLTDNYSYLQNMTLSNSACAIDGNGKNVQITDCWIQANQLGGQTFIDSDISKSTFSANGTDLNLSGGVASNRIIGNRFEYTQNGHSISAYNPSGNEATVATNAATASGTTLHFASTSAIVAGTQIFNSTHPSSIALGTYVVSKTGTTVTLNQSVVSAVSSGDSLFFYQPNGDFTTISNNQFDAAFLNGINLQFCRGWSLTGNNFRRCGYGAVANSGNDAGVFLANSNSIAATGNTMEVYQAFDTAPYNLFTPSYGFYDGGANFNCQIKGNPIVYNPVDGTHGGGVNTTALSFPNFNTDNVSARMNSVIRSLP